MVFVSGVLLLSACATANPGSTGAAPVTSSADVTRDARLLQMTDLRKLDTVLVDELLSSNNTALRARAALAVGQVKGRARYARLRQLMVDADTAVAANAAFALGLGKDTNSIVALARAFAGAPDPVAIAAAWSLGDLGEPSRSVLTLALGDGIAQPLVTSTAAQRNADVRAALVIATSKLRTPPVATLVPWLADRDVQVVRSVAYVLARARSAGGVRAMMALRGSGDEETRQYVARILAKTAAGDSLGTRALEALNVLVTDTSSRVRVNAVRSLATYGASVKESLMHALRDSDGNVRVAAAESVVPMLGSDAAAWKAAWAVDSTLPVRIAIMMGARRAGSAALQTAEDEWQRSADWRQRNSVLQSRRADSAHSTRVDDVLWAIKDSDARVRTTAAGALRDVQGDNPALGDTVRKLWWNMLNDADYAVRASVTSSLRATANAEGVPAILDAYTKALTDRDNDARMAAIVYLANAWQRDSARINASLRARIAALAAPRDSAERAGARAITPLAAWKSATFVTPPKPLSEYELVARKYLAIGAKPQIAILHTERGDITLALSGRETPLTVDNFVQLVKRGYYRNTYFHRVVPNFVAQDGDARGDGTGSPGYTIRDELTRQIHARGCFAMARAGPDTGSSQYYMCHSPQPHLDGAYTVFGHILQGFDVLDRIVQTDRLLSIEIR